MTDISYQNIESASYNDVFNIVNDRTLIQDPRTGTVGGRTFIYDLDPLHKSMGFQFLPYIILELPTIEYDRISEDGRYKFIKWKQAMIVRAARDGSANTRTDVGRSDILAIGDNLQTAFNSGTVKQSLSYQGISKIYLTKTGTDVITIDQKQMYEATYELDYERRTKVTQI